MIKRDAPELEEKWAKNVCSEAKLGMDCSRVKDFDGIYPELFKKVKKISDSSSLRKYYPYKIIKEKAPQLIEAYSDKKEVPWEKFLKVSSNIAKDFCTIVLDKNSWVDSKRYFSEVDKKYDNLCLDLDKNLKFDSVTEDLKKFINDAYAPYVKYSVIEAAKDKWWKGGADAIRDAIDNSNIDNGVKIKLLDLYDGK